jgi:hypothetical protein
MKLADVLRICRKILIVILLGALVTWAAAAPIVWIVRDGLGPGMVETAWPRSVYKFLVLWGVPALVLTVPLIILWFIDRRAVKPSDPSR